MTKTAVMVVVEWVEGVVKVAVGVEVGVLSAVESASEGVVMGVYMEGLMSSSRDKLTRYYLLCTIRMGSKAHVVDELIGRAQPAHPIFTAKEMDLYFRKQDGHYTAREIVIGGEDGDMTTPPALPQRHARHPAIII